MIERLRRYVAIRSLSREETALADAIAADLRAVGLEVKRRGNNVWCEFGDAPGPRLLLNSHLDTVPAGEGWSHDPWTPQIANGALSGLGANDAKGCVTAMIECAMELKRFIDAGGVLSGTIVLALTAEEEISGQGLSAILNDLGPIDAALVGEPTGLTPMTAQRGLLIVMGRAHGRTGHPANTSPQSADNAIAVAAADIRRLGDFEWGQTHPLLGRTHAHVTQIHGGIARNVIPDSCEFTLDIRTTPVETHRATFARLQSAMQSELRIHSERLVPVETATEHPIVAACMNATGRAPAGSPAMSDMVFLSGVPAVKIGPGESCRSHTPNEYLLESELIAGAKAYECIARTYFSTCSGDAGKNGRLTGVAGSSSQPVVGAAR